MLTITKVELFVGCLAPGYGKAYAARTFLSRISHGVTAMLFNSGFHDLRQTTVTSPDADTVEMRLPANGREVFTPPLVAGRVYRFSVIGIYRSRLFTHSYRYADAVYLSDTHQNLTMRYDGLLIDGISIQQMEVLDAWQENRPRNEYSGLLEGTGAQRSVQLISPDLSYGSVLLRLELLPEGTPSVAAVLQARAADRARELDAKATRAKEEEERCRSEARIAEERSRVTAEQKRHAAALHALTLLQQSRNQRVRELQRMVHSNRNILDAQFRAAFVHKYQEALLSEYKETWTAEYDHLLADEELVELLRDRAPEVIEWHEARIGMILHAERLATMPIDEGQPEPQEPQVAVPVTERTIGMVENSIDELFQMRGEYDYSRQQQAADGHDRNVQQKGILSKMACIFEQLQRFGINAKTPEEAEEQLRVMWPYEPAKTVYEELHEKIEAGEAVGIGVIGERVKDLFHEQCILVAQRRSAIREKRWDHQHELDQRIAAARAEFSRWTDFLRARGHNIELRATVKEETLAEGIVRLCQEKIQVKQFLEQIGDSEAAEAVEALYAEHQANLFKPNTESYT